MAISLYITLFTYLGFVRLKYPVHGETWVFGLPHIASLLGFEDIRSLLLQPTEARGAEAARVVLESTLADAREAGHNF